MGKVVQVVQPYSYVSLPPLGSAYNAGDSTTLTDAEYAALDSSVVRSLTVTSSGVAEPVRGTPTNGTARVFVGSSQTPSAGKFLAAILTGKVVFGGTFSSETATATFTATFSDNTTQTTTVTATATGTQLLTDANRLALLKDGLAIKSLGVTLASTAAASAVTAVVTVAGLQQS